MTSQRVFSHVSMRRMRTAVALLVAFSVTASSASAAIFLHSVRYVLYSNMLYVTGTVSDTSGADTEGYQVNYTGDVSGSTTVDSEGEIAFMTPFVGTYGEASLQANDGAGQTSNVVSIEFVE